MATLRPFLDLTAEDLMTKDVRTIPQNMPLRDAAHLLAEAHISGAPVVDAAGRCVGVLSATDLMRWADAGHRSARRTHGAWPCVWCDWEVIEVDDLPPDTVSLFMCTDVVRATPAARVGELARWMLDAHIHRVIITDENDRPVGVVSSTDILAAVAAEQARAGPREDDD
jgi:CBS-domain-containing membrane protein